MIAALSCFALVLVAVGAFAGLAWLYDYSVESTKRSADEERKR